MGTVSQNPVRFGVFELDRGSGQLRKNGVRIKLQDQPLGVLLILLERPGQVVTKEELKQRLWSVDTFVEFDKGIYNAINRLRETLSDGAETPRYIETIPKRGYRFLGEVHEIGSRADSFILDEQPPLTMELTGSAIEQRPNAPPVEGEGKYRHIKRLWISVGATVVSLLCGLGIWKFSINRPEARPAIEVVPLVGLPGFESDPAFSPDGKQVAFALRGNEISGIYTSMVGGEKSLRLTNNATDCCPRWSPDGQRIAFSRRSDDGVDIYLIPALGGTEHRLSSRPSEEFLTGHPFGRSLDWSPDGKLVAFSDIQKDKTHAWISLLSVVDSTTRRLTSPTPKYLDHSPAFSPDGSTVAFVRGTAAGVVEDIYIAPVSEGESKRLTFDNTWLFGPPTWTPDGRYIVFSSMRGGLASLWRISASGGPPQPVQGLGAIAEHPSVSPKGDQLVYLQMAFKTDISRLDLRDGKISQGPPVVVIPDKGLQAGRPQFSPDGKRIVFESNRLGYSEIWACDTDGSNCGQLTSLHGIAGASRWSPDGQSIAFEYRPKGHSEIYLLDVKSSVPRMLTTLPGADNGGPNWSRDGKWLYFYSDYGGGSFQLWKVQVSGGRPVQVTKSGGIFGTESSDGHFLFFSKFEYPGVWRMPLNGGQEVQVLEQPAGEDWWNWVLVQNGIYFIDSISRTNQRDSNSTATVKFFDFETRKLSSILTVAKSNSFGLALSPNCDSILYTQREFAESTIMLVKNFR
jgi:Tol biopolymer transport system component/DNA-binding winged helix-turn-helix (wHTH) protein